MNNDNDDDFGPSQTFKKSLVLAKQIANLPTRDKRKLFQWMRVYGSNMDAQKFFPSVGVTAGEFATYFILADRDTRCSASSSASASSTGKASVAGKKKSQQRQTHVNTCVRPASQAGPSGTYGTMMMPPPGIVFDTQVPFDPILHHQLYQPYHQPVSLIENHHEMTNTTHPLFYNQNQGYGSRPYDYRPQNPAAFGAVGARYGEDRSSHDTTDTYRSPAGHYVQAFDPRPHQSNRT